jgi:hypothetical protein
VDQNTTSHKKHANIDAPPFSATQIAYIRQLICEEIEAALKGHVTKHSIGMRPQEVK